MGETAASFNYDGPLDYLEGRYIKLSDEVMFIDKVEPNDPKGMTRISGKARNKEFVWRVYE